MNVPLSTTHMGGRNSPIIALFLPSVGISLFLFTFFIAINYLAIKLFFNYSFCLENKSDKSSKSASKILQDYCWNISMGISDISIEADDWNYYITIATCIVGIFPTAVLGAWGDLHNRKHAVLVPVAGSTLGMTICFILTYLAPERLLNMRVFH